MSERSPIGWLVGMDSNVPVFKNRVIAIGRLENDLKDSRVTRIQIDNPHISATHCYIWLIQFDANTSNVCYFKDVSRNTCYVNNKRVGKGRFNILRNGDYVKLYDKFGFTFKLDEKVNIPMGDQISRINNWIIMPEVIGVGTFGKVQIAYNNEYKNKYYAVKTILIKNESKESKTEYKILSKLDHSNIIKIKETIIDSKNGNIKMFQELAIGGDLFSYLSQDGDVLQSLPESEAIFALYQICNALYYLHCKGIVHRDLKLDNILIMGVPIRYPHLSIGDFGIAKQNSPLFYSSINNFNNNQLNSQIKIRENCNNRQNFLMKTMVGTAEYAAPEINLSKIVNKKFGAIDDFFINNNDNNNEQHEYTEKVDSWSLGVVGHILLSGISPFYSDNIEEIIKKSKKGKIYLETDRWNNVSQISKDFIRGCLTINSEKRQSIQECLQSDMFNNGQRKELIKALLNHESRFQL